MQENKLKRHIVLRYRDSARWSELTRSKDRDQWSTTSNFLGWKWHHGMLSFMVVLHCAIAGTEEEGVAVIVVARWNNDEQ